MRNQNFRTRGGSRTHILGLAGILRFGRIRCHVCKQCILPLYRVRFGEQFRMETHVLSVELPRQYFICFFYNNLFFLAVRFCFYYQNSLLKRDGLGKVFANFLSYYRLSFRLCDEFEEALFP